MKKLNFLGLILIIFAFGSCEKEEQSIIQSGNEFEEKTKAIKPHNKSIYQYIDLSTGLASVNPATYSSPGSADLNWDVKAQGASQYIDAAVSTGIVEWNDGTTSNPFPNRTQARWIATSINGNNNIPYTTPRGASRYKRTFYIDCPDYNIVALYFNDIMADDEILAIEVNGNLIQMPSPPIKYSPGVVTRYIHQDITSLARLGYNTIRITVYNQNPGFSAFYLLGGINLFLDDSCDDNPTDPGYDFD